MTSATDEKVTFSGRLAYLSKELANVCLHLGLCHLRFRLKHMRQQRSFIYDLLSAGDFSLIFFQNESQSFNEK